MSSYDDWLEPYEWEQVLFEADLLMIMEAIAFRKGLDDIFALPEDDDEAAALLRKRIVHYLYFKTRMQLKSPEEYRVTARTVHHDCDSIINICQRELLARGATRRRLWELLLSPRGLWQELQWRIDHIVYMHSLPRS